MHGVIFRALKEHVTEEHGEDVWSEMMDAAGIEPKLYLPVSYYPDRELHALVAAGSDVTGRSEADLLEGFGADLAPDLLDTFSTYVPDEWGTLEVLANLGEIYDAVESGTDEADTPDVDPERDGENAVVVRYRSDRELCDLGTGIVRGVAEAYGDSVRVREDACMHDGADACEIRVTLQ